MDKLHRERVRSARLSSPIATSLSATSISARSPDTSSTVKRHSESASNALQKPIRAKRIKLSIGKPPEIEGGVEVTVWAKNVDVLASASPFASTATGKCITSAGGYLKGLLLEKDAFLGPAGASNQQDHHIDVRIHAAVPDSALQKSIDSASLVAVTAQRDKTNKHLINWPPKTSCALLGWYTITTTWSDTVEKSSRIGKVSKKKVRRARLCPAREPTGGPEAGLRLPDLVHGVHADDKGQYTVAVGRPAALLDTALRCPLCRFALPRVKWHGWACKICKISIPAPAIDVAADLFASRWTFDYSGPRLDNGWAVFDQSVSRRILVWTDGVKTTTYSEVNGSLVLHHVLASGHLYTSIAATTRALFAPTMLYRRRKKQAHLAASFSVGPSLSEQANIVPEGAKVVLESTNDAILRFAEENVTTAEAKGNVESTMPFDRIELFVMTAGKLDLSKLIKKAVKRSRRVAIRHFGAPAQLVLRRVEHAESGDATSKHDVATILVSPGDIVYLPDNVSLNTHYELELLVKSFSATCIMGHTEPL